MSKFWAIVITSEKKLNRVWTDTPTVLAYLSKNRSAKIYRVHEYQQAIFIEASNPAENQILWEDVSEINLGVQD